MNRREFFEAVAAAGLVLTTGPTEWVESGPIDNTKTLYFDAIVGGRIESETDVSAIYVRSEEPEESDWRPLYIGTETEFGPVSIAAAFGGQLPRRWSLGMGPEAGPIAAIPVESVDVQETGRLITEEGTFGKPFVIRPTKITYT